MIYNKNIEKYGYILGIENSNIKKILQTEQFALSEEIWNKRVNLGFNIDEMAFRLDMDIEDYFKYEYVDISLPVRCYENILSSINKIVEKDNKEV